MSQNGFAASRWTHQEEMMTSGSCNSKALPGKMLSWKP
jgi:hypothetical protein